MTDKSAWEPPLFAWTQLGPIPVELTEKLEHDGERLAGVALPYGRKIILDSGLEDQATRVIFAHEWVHMVLHDAGIILPPDQEEAVCTTVATAMVASEDFHAAGGVPASDCAVPGLSSTP